MKKDNSTNNSTISLENSSETLNRRDLFKAAAVTAGVGILLPLLAQAEGRRGGGKSSAGPALVDPKDAQSKAVNYVHKGSEVKDKALQTERSGVAFKDQKCSGCAFYDATKETTIGGMKAAPCSLPFAGGKNVSATGWCTTWAKKA